MSKLFILIAILISLFTFAQQDSLCADDKGDFLIDHIFISYERFITLPEENEPQLFGCGSAAHAFFKEIKCKKFKLLLEKYSFIFNDIRANEKDEAKFKYLDVFWIQNQKYQEDEEQLNFTLDEDKTEAYTKWKLKNQYKSIAIAVIVDEMGENIQHVQLKILFPREKREITKEYKLYESVSNWNYEIL